MVFPKLIFLRILDYTINVRITRKTSHHMFIGQNGLLISSYVWYLFNFVDFWNAKDFETEPIEDRFSQCVSSQIYKFFQKNDLPIWLTFLAIPGQV